MYTITNSVSLVLYVWAGGFAVLNIKDTLFTFSMIGSSALEDRDPYNVATWFVCALISTYLLFYVICYLTRTKQTAYIICLIVMIVWGYWLERANFSFPYCFVHNGEAFLNFFSGCLLYELMKWYWAYRKKFAAAAFAVLVAVICLSAVLEFKNLCGDVRVTVSWVLCPCVLICSMGSAAGGWIFNRKLIQKAGSLSTYIFFWHLPLAVLCMRIGLLGGDRWNQTVAYLVYIILLFIITIGTKLAEGRLRKRVTRTAEGRGLQR